MIYSSACTFISFTEHKDVVSGTTSATTRCCKACVNLGWPTSTLYLSIPLEQLVMTGALSVEQTSDTSPCQIPSSY
eukprot:1178880-Prorocentrum_minimum.AAC.5